MNFDAVNAFFELFGGILLLLNIRQLIRDKSVKGVHLAPVLFFTCWGVWNLIYYWELKQTLSWYAGIIIVVTNGTWVSLAIYYKHKQKKRNRCRHEKSNSHEKSKNEIQDKDYHL